MLRNEKILMPRAREFLEKSSLLIIYNLHKNNKVEYEKIQVNNGKKIIDNFYID